FSNSPANWFWFAPDISHGPSEFDVRHSASINGIWQVPVSQSLHGPAAAVLRGWELGGILKMNSGIPTTPLIGGGPLRVKKSRGDQFSLSNCVKGCGPGKHKFKNKTGGIFLGFIKYDYFYVAKASP